MHGKLDSVSTVVGVDVTGRWSAVRRRSIAEIPEVCVGGRPAVDGAVEDNPGSLVRRLIRPGTNDRRRTGSNLWRFTPATAPEVRS